MRKNLLYILITGSGIIFLVRLLSLQVLSSDYDDKSLQNSVLREYIYPKRGFIYDRNGTLIVENQATYDLMIIPRQLQQFDTLEFCKLLKIDKKNLVEKVKKARSYSTRKPSVFLAQLSKSDYAVLQEKLWKYQGFYVQKRAIRKYNTASASNILGYISEVNRFDIRKDPYYQSGELIGRQGIEKTYEKTLRGVKGVRYLQRDKFNRVIGPYQKGELDTLPTQAQDLHLTIDIALQEYGQKLLQNKRGGIVAIEPETGEILVNVSTPTYAPDLLVGRSRSENFNMLKNDTINRPLFDRGLQGQYPPGSPFKLVNALVALHEEAITPRFRVLCNEGHYYGRTDFMKCHCNYGTKNQLNSGIYNSCNTYFATIYRRTIDRFEDPKKGMNIWSNHIKSFGMGNYLGYDHPTGQKGFIPNSDYYDYWYPKQRWGATTSLSNSIGQGEVLTTPIQLANMVATIANRGYFYKPHFVKKIQKDSLNKKYRTPNYSTIDSIHFEPVVEGMSNVVKWGTARIARVPGVEVCGKTGTVENFTKIDGEKVQLTDHSMFVAFAPRENPKIAV
ncbi:MAG: penicillin-binding transpeptidase domain-containing protein, partial [Bacteroidota bacterium]|nr:penicillin-binding transpeptidase domain-containing protein [Bacteroidota bacterium]